LGVAVPPAIAIISAPISAVITISAAAAVLVDAEVSAAAVIHPQAAGIHAPGLALDAGRAADLPIKIDPIVGVAAAVFAATVVALALYRIVLRMDK
jgi:hypothetical protein